ncbi:MAG: NACHT domain-containing protein [Dolichospermum sp. BR01]|nr:NACHT domain-containing protein [Dolichospermum sp. BR01]
MDDSQSLYNFAIQEIEKAQTTLEEDKERNINLNATEREVLMKLIEGKSYQQISKELGKAEKYIRDDLAPKIYKNISYALQLNRKIDDFYTINKNNIRPELAKLVRQTAENGLRVNYSSYIRERCGSLDIVYPSDITSDSFPETNSSSRIKEDKLQIEALYVQPKLGLIQEGKNTVSRLDIKPLEDIIDISKSEASLRWIVYGHSGYGKTSLLKYLTVKCDKGKFRNNSIPIYISLKRYINHINQERQQNLLDYVVTVVTNQSDFVCEDINENDLKNHLKSFLSKGKIIIFLDGLDIAGDKDSLLLNSVRNFIDLYPQNSFIISTHKKQYSSLNGFKEYELQELDDEQRKKFIKQRLIYFDKDIKSQKINALYAIINEKYIKEFVSSPLLLAYVCLIQNSLENFTQLETNEEKEVLLCKLGIFELLKWDDAPENKYDKDEIYKTMSPKRRADFLSYLAIEMLKSRKEGYIHLSELVNYSARFIFPVPNAENKEEFRLKSEQILLAIETQDGLLTRRIFSQDPEYSFPHKTIRDFFAAWWLSHLNIEEQLKYWETYVKYADNPDDKSEWQNIFQKALIMIKIQQNELNEAHNQLKDKLKNPGI